MKKNEYRWITFFRYTLGILFRLVYWPKLINTKAIPKDESVVICGNHLHHFDPIMVLLSSKRQIIFMSKLENASGFFGLFSRKVGTIFVKREDEKSKKDAKEKCDQLLANKGALGIFPEGTRNKTDEKLLPFQFGAVSFAKKNKSTVVPFAIRGEYKAFKKGLEIEFGMPFKVKDMTLDDANKKLYNDVLELLNKKD